MISRARTLFPLFFFLVMSARAQLSGQAAQRAYTIARMVEIYHVQPRPMDEAWSADLFRLFLGKLDADRMYFTAPDLRALEAFRPVLAWEVGKRRTVFVDLAVDLFRTRIRETDSLLNEFLTGPVSLTGSLVLTRAEDSTAAETSDARKEKLRKLFSQSVWQSMAELLVDDSTLAPKADSLEKAVRRRTAHGYRRDIQQILQGPGGLEGFVCGAWCEAVAEAFDPHTEYFSLQQKEEFQGSMGGRRMQFGFVLDDGKAGVEITRLVPGSPAFQSGLLNEGDLVLAIQWEGNAEVDVSDADREEVNALVAENRDKLLTLTVRKSDGSLRRVNLRRARTRESDPDGKVRSFVLRGARRIGFISLPAFYTDWDEDGASTGCANDVAREIVRLKKENIEGLILDIRYNGGGSMSEATALAKLFVEKGPVGMITDREGDVKPMRQENRGAVYGGPLLLLVNGYSASASEILAGILQDYHRGLIVGTTTYGKATAQVLMPLDTLFDETHFDRMRTAQDFIKVTVERLYRVTGASAQRTGVVPDIFLRDFTETMPDRESALTGALVNAPIAGDRRFHPLPALPLEKLRVVAKAYSDTCRFVRAMNEATLRFRSADSLRSDTLSLAGALADERANADFLDLRDARPLGRLPYRVDGTAAERQKMRTDRARRLDNQSVMAGLSRDPAVMIAYQVMVRMKGVGGRNLSGR